MSLFFLFGQPAQPSAGPSGQSGITCGSRGEHGPFASGEEAVGMYTDNRDHALYNRVTISAIVIQQTHRDLSIMTTRWHICDVHLYNHDQ